MDLVGKFIVVGGVRLRREDEQTSALDRHAGELAATTDEIVGQMFKGRAVMFGKRESDEDRAKLAATQEGIVALEAAYRQFFADHNVRALLLPCFQPHTFLGLS